MHSTEPRDEKRPAARPIDRATEKETTVFVQPHSILRALSFIAVIAFAAMIGADHLNDVLQPHLGTFGAQLLETSLDTILICIAADYLLTRQANSHWRALREVERHERAILALKQSEDLRAEADRQNLAKSEFLSRMSHELRTPLNSILGFGQLLEMDFTEGVPAESLGHILKAGRHLLGIIDEILDLARIESGSPNISMTPVCIDDAIRLSIDMVRPLCNQRDLSVEYASPLAQQCVRADEQRLRQVLLNLLSNAAKYNRPQGAIKIELEERSSQRLRVSISDTGPGIGPEYLPRLFQPFDRLDAGNTDIQGTGLGLAVSKRLMDLMDGEIGVRSQLDFGTTFWIELPVAEPPLRAPHLLSGESGALDLAAAEQLSSPDAKIQLPVP